MNELFKALSIAQGEIENATKNKTNPHFKSKYADLASCIDAAKESLAKNGLCVIQKINKVENDVLLITVLGHTSGSSIQSETPVLFTQNSMQAMGSAITYARRYAFCAMIGLSQDDDDANTAGNNEKQNSTESKSQVDKLIGGQTMEKRHMKPTAPMMTRLWAIQKASGLTAEQVDKYCFDNFECNIGDINSEQYEKICNSMQEVINKKKESK